MRISNQTAPAISNAMRAIARFSHDPNKVNTMAARKIIEHLNTTTHLLGSDV